MVELILPPPLLVTRMGEIEEEEDLSADAGRLETATGLPVTGVAVAVAIDESAGLVIIAAVACLV